VFCPGCRVHAEALIPEEHPARWLAILYLWHVIVSQISVLLGLPGPEHDFSTLVFDATMPDTDTVTLFRKCFPKPAGVIRSWTTVKKERIRYRAQIIGRFGFVVVLKPLAIFDNDSADLGEEFPIDSEMRFYFLDWNGQTHFKRELFVDAMPNPAESERLYLPYIVAIPGASLSEDVTCATPKEERGSGKQRGLCRKISGSSSISSAS
jgi:hypothetical protein